MFFNNKINSNIIFPYIIILKLLCDFIKSKYKQILNSNFEIGLNGIIWSRNMFCS